MQKTKDGKNINNSQELYRLIASLCLRSVNYNKSDILALTKEKLQHSCLKVSDIVLSEMVNNTFKFLERYQLIIYENGCYNRKTGKVVASTML